MFGILKTVLQLTLPLLVCAVAVCVSAFLITATVRQIKRQVKLYNSIKLVELKSGKIRYWAFIPLIAFFVFYLVTQIFDPQAPERVMMSELFALKNWQYNMTLSFAVLLLAAVEAFLLTLALSKSAVVDKGIYTEYSYLDWYRVHDYIIDEDRGVVILSSNKYTFRTLDGTTPPMKVAANDIPKLKFILNKNKNKFSSSDDGGEPVKKSGFAD